MSYPTIKLFKLTTHTLPNPKTQQKTHNPQQPTCYPTQKLNSKLTTHNFFVWVVSFPLSFWVGSMWVVVGCEFFVEFLGQVACGL